MKNIVAICGSNRKDSINMNLIKAIVNLSSNTFHIQILATIDQLPHYNPDIDNTDPPESIINYRNTLKKSDGIIICTPEYAMGVPGTLKNAIDWTVSSMEFSTKPTALITAASVGEKSHFSFLETLKIIEAKINKNTTLLIPFCKTKINLHAEIIDKKTNAEIKKLLKYFDEII